MWNKFGSTHVLIIMLVHILVSLLETACNVPIKATALLSHSTKPGNDKNARALIEF